MKTKHGKYSFNPNLSERDLKESEHYITGIEYCLFDLKLSDVNDIVIECTLAEYEALTPTDNPNHGYARYFLDIWWDDEVNCYSTRNFSNLKSTFHKWIRHIEKLIDDNQLNENSLKAFYKQINEETEARKKYDDKQHSKRLFAKRVRYTFPTAFKGGR